MSPLGTLYVVATPIGNLSDLTHRAEETLRSADELAAEDTRRCRKLLSHLGLRKPIVRCDEAMEGRVAPRILESLRSGRSVALVTDAGSPALSDPGGRLVQAVSEAGIPVVPIPGPSAITTLLSACGLPVTPFVFYGFLPRKGRVRKERIERIAKEPDASVLFEGPWRVGKTLGEIAAQAPDRMACLGRELTKIHEEIVRAPLNELARWSSQRTLRGECTIVVGAESPRKKVRRFEGRKEEE